MNLMIVRHAESVGNVEGRLQGQEDYPLSTEGRQQVALLKERFRSENYRPTHVYTSPLSRTFETAEIVATQWELQIIKWDDLMETNVGVFSGLTWEEALERFPEMARSFEETRTPDAVDGAESFPQRSARALRVVDKLMSLHEDDDRVLVFSHGGIIQYIIAHLLGSRRTWGLGVRNTGVFEFEIDVGRWNGDNDALANPQLWRINRFNDADHLR